MASIFKAMTSDNKLPNAITLPEAYPEIRLESAKSKRLEAEQRLKEAKAEKDGSLKSIRAQISELQSELAKEKKSIPALKECIRVRESAGKDSTSDKADLSSTETRIVEMSEKLKDLSHLLPSVEARTQSVVEEAAKLLNKAIDAEQKIRPRFEKAARAHAAYLENPACGVGPMPKFISLKDAIRHYFKIGFTLSETGDAREAFLGTLTQINLRNGRISGMLPASLDWLRDFHPYSSFPNYRSKCHIIDAELTSERHFSHHFFLTYDRHGQTAPDAPIRFYVENSRKCIANSSGRKIYGPEMKADDSYGDLFSPLPETLAPYIEELTRLGSLDLQSTGELPLLAELIIESWQKASASISKPLPFEGNQPRLSESQINELVGAYWRAFIASPWEPSTEGTYALLKHRCSRGETPNVFSFETKGHFGFRVRTPDHDWIKGEIYCPPENFRPEQAPDPMQLVNHPGGEDWLAELGPVKFVIRGNTSRS